MQTNATDPAKIASAASLFSPVRIQYLVFPFPPRGPLPKIRRHGFEAVQHPLARP
jgi:hypothetical protein